MVLSLLAIITIILGYKDKLVHNLKFICAIALLSAFGSMDLLTSLYIFATHSSQTFFSGSTSTLFNNTINIIQGFNTFSESAVSLTSLCILGIGLLSYLFVRNERTAPKKIVLSILAVFIFAIALVTTINAPFGMAFLKLLNAIPYLLVFRYPNGALTYLLIFLTSTLFGIGAAYLINLFAKHEKFARYRLLFPALLVIVLASYIYTNDYVPATAHTSYENTTFVSIPNYAFQTADYINSQNASSPIALLPQASGWQFTSWYFGVNVYSALLINHPVYTGGFTDYAEIFFPESVNEYAYFIGNITDGIVNAANSNVSNLFGVFGISYIIVQGDVLHSVPFQCDGCYIPHFNLSDIYYNLNDSADIHFLKAYSNTSIYKNTNYVPLVFATNIRDVGAASYSEILGAIENESFNIHNTSIYVNNDTTGISNASAQMAINPITNFSQPSITFSEATPTRVIARVRNATTPYYLTFRETYDPSWSAYYSNGTTVLSGDHIEVDGFENAWYMNKQGNYSITLYYTTQSTVWPAYAISIIAIATTICIGIFGLKNAKRTKQNCAS